MIIAFTGKAGAGKSTAAGMLIDIAITGLFYTTNLWSL
jgi:dephospho-CoA kinase